MDGKTGHLAAKYMAIVTSLYTLYASRSWLPYFTSRGKKVLLASP